MTLDEAIKHAEEVAEEQKELYGLCPASESGLSHCDGTNDCKTLKNGKNKGCLKCAEEHRQLAEWLKDYKRLLEQEPSDDLVSRQTIKRQMIKYGFHAPDMTVTEFVEDLPPVIQQELKYCDRNICLKNEYNGIGCDECEVAKMQEPKTTGHWIKYGIPRCGEQHYKCTSCEYYINFGQWGELYTKEFKYCPNCGAKMQEEE